MSEKKWHLREAKGFERKRMKPLKLWGRAGAGVEDGEGKITSTAKVQGSELS